MATIRKKHRAPMSVFQRDPGPWSRLLIDWLATLAVIMIFGLVSLALLVLVGCRSHPEIPVNDEQSLVMESSLLAAGISAEKPVLSTSDIQPSASSTLYNERQEPVTVHYRFYWYDARGLEMHPLERPRSVTIPAHSAVTLYGSANFLGAHKVRLYLYL